MPNLPHFTGFQWDEGNREKNWVAHKVSIGECEEVFFHEPLVMPDIKHSGREERYYALGKTGKGRILFLSFTRRKSLMRVISARDASRKERKQYESYKKNP